MPSYIDMKMRFDPVYASNGQLYFCCFYQGAYIRSFKTLEEAQDYMNTRYSG